MLNTSFGLSLFINTDLTAHQDAHKRLVLQGYLESCGLEGSNIHEEGKEVVKWVEPACQQLLAMQAVS